MSTKITWQFFLAIFDDLCEVLDNIMLSAYVLSDNLFSDNICNPRTSRYQTSY
jgi:hypothetical protein